MTVIQILGYAAPLPAFEMTGWYVKEYDAHDGEHGRLVLTPHINEAKLYDSKLHAFLEIQTTSRTYPKRPDGRPNRPLTAFHCSIEEV